MVLPFGSKKNDAWFSRYPGFALLYRECLDMVVAAGQAAGTAS